MRTIVLLFCLAVAYSNLNAQTLVVGENRRVSASESYSTNERPRVRCDGNGVAHLIWGAGPINNGHILYVSAAAGEDFGAAQTLSAGTNYGYLIDAAAGPTLRVRGNYVVAGWDDNNANNRGFWVARSTNGGVTWEPPVRTNPNSPGQRFYNAAAVFPDGRMSQMWLAHTSGLSDPHFRWTMQDSSGNFLPWIDASAASPDEVCECCWPDQVVLEDGQTVVTVFRNNHDNLRVMHASRSTDGGLSFAHDTEIDQSGWVINACPVSGPGLDDDGNTLLCSFMSAATDTMRIYTARSLDGGATWEPMVEIDGGHAGPQRNYPQVAVEGNLAVVVWQESNEEFFTEIHAAVSTDTGRTWGERAIVSTAPAAICAQGAVDIAPGGEVIFAWHDTRENLPRIYSAWATVSTLDYSERANPTPNALTVNVHPNPFNAITRIRLSIPTDQRAAVRIFDVMGREVALLAEHAPQGGMHEYLWDASAQSSGIYFCRVRGAGFATMAKLVLMK